MADALNKQAEVFMRMLDMKGAQSGTNGTDRQTADLRPVHEGGRAGSVDGGGRAASVAGIAGGGEYAIGDGSGARGVVVSGDTEGGDGIDDIIADAGKRVTGAAKSGGKAVGGGKSGSKA
jgi:hypothetical protein